MRMDLLSAERDILSAVRDIRVGEIDFLDVEEVLLWVGLAFAPFYFSGCAWRCRAIRNSIPAAITQAATNRAPR